MVSNIEKSAALLSNYQDQVATCNYRLLVHVRVRVRSFGEAEGIEAIFSWLTD